MISLPMALGELPSFPSTPPHPCLPVAGLTGSLRATAATVQCLLEGHFVLVVPRGLSTQPYNLDSVRLASSQPGCEPLRVTEAFVMFRFAVTQCGTTVQVGMRHPPSSSPSPSPGAAHSSLAPCLCPPQVIEDRLIYENQLISTIDVQGSPRGSITRDSIYM